MSKRKAKRRICFVTGTRAEFGLMRTTLEAIRDHPKLELQLIVTGMHLHGRHGRSLGAIRQAGWRVDATVPWPEGASDGPSNAVATGRAIAGIATALQRLESDIVLVVGDRVEAFAAATAGHISHRVVAHVHGGDRAEGQIDDSLRHAITKLAHIHFPATAVSARRIAMLGEDRWRIHRAGSPGIDRIGAAANHATLKRAFPDLVAQQFALVLLHPTDNTAVEAKRVDQVFAALDRAGIAQRVVLYPNNDPGADRTIRRLEHHRPNITHLLKDAPRDLFLSLLRDAAFLIGNSSSGIIEAASLGTFAINIGDRQKGRERSRNVIDVPWEPSAIEAAIGRVFRKGLGRRYRGMNVYGGGRTGAKIAAILSDVPLDERLRRKLIRY